MRTRSLLPLLLLLLLAGCLTYVDDLADDDDVADDDDAANDDDATADPDDRDGDGVTAAQGDCDDGNSAVFPGADEECNGRDDDCDELVDEGLTESAFRPDADGDGFVTSNAALEVEACAAPPGLFAATEPFDCADSDPTIFPEAPEVCNGIDDDCFGGVDDGVTTSLYADTDGDGYGAGASVGEGCPGEGYSAQGDDCDDGDALLSPEDVDGDGVSGCAGDCDDGDAGIVPGQDADGDGQDACGDDCDDTAPDVFTGATEVCNLADDNCDGVIDDGLKSAVVVRGAAPLPGSAVASGLSSLGYCVAPTMQVSAITSATSFEGMQLVVVTADTGNAGGWYGDTDPLSAWYWSFTGGGAVTPALVGMGLGGLGLFEALGIDPDLELTKQYQQSGGTVQAQMAGTSFWQTPNQVVVGTNNVTVHTQSFATVRALTSESSTMRVLARTVGSAPAIVDVPAFWDGQTSAYYWAFEQGLNQATAAGTELFENLVYDAIGPP